MTRANFSTSDAIKAAGSSCRLTRADHRQAVLIWARRSMSNVRKAIPVLQSHHELGGAHDKAKSIGRFYGLGRRGHALNASPHRWVSLTEVQITRGFAHFLGACAERNGAFLRALSPDICWPDNLVDVSAQAEAPTGSGRIDLQITGTVAGQRWGATVEAKLSHRLVNGLSAYAAHAAKLGVRLDGPPGDTGVLIILGCRRSADVQARLVRPRRRAWRFLSWDTFLRRLERNLCPATDDEDFRRFRRTVWEQTNARHHW